ncbi:MAG: NAD(P)-binding domain-containing protein, partial [Cypionkella sp.]
MKLRRRDVTLPQTLGAIMAQMRVGFVGLGLMGQGMAANIVAKGYPLVVYAHRNRAPVEDLIARGATEAASLADLAGSCDAIFLCLSGSPQVTEVVAALKPGLARGAVLVDCSTSDPVVTEGLARDLASIGVDFADAPLSR